MHLILTGGGDSHHFLQIDKYFIESLGANPTLLYIPLAQKKSLWKQGLGRIRENFKSIEFDHIEMCKELADLDWDYLKKFSAIYIDGGNTFRLMNAIRDTHTYELLHRFLHHGGIINGDSAGAIVLGSHLETAHFGQSGDENKAGIISYQGLNFLGDYAIHCHYDVEEDTEIKEFSREYGFPVMALHEETSIAVRDNEIEVIGESPLAIFNGDIKFIAEVGVHGL